MLEPVPWPLKNLIDRLQVAVLLWRLHRHRRPLPRPPAG
jgi:hypothetical protein